MTVCGGWSAINYRGPVTRAISLFCRSWGCPDCQPRRLNKLKRLAMNGEPTTFLTLTVNPIRGESPTERARELVDAMRILFKRARRRWPKHELEYLAVFEETKKGEPHLHILLRAPYMPQKWISDTMNELIQAPIVDIRRVWRKHLVARYVAKYVAKGPKSFGDLKRYWHTKRYDTIGLKRVNEDDYWGSGWRCEQEPLWLIAERWQKQGYDVVIVSSSELWSMGRREAPS
jgi:hypothetical protein